MQRSNNNIERKGKELDKKQLAELEKIEFDVEQDLLRTLKEMYENERKGSQTFSDWLKSKPIDELRKIELKRGGIIKDPRFDFYANGGTVAEKYEDLIDAYDKGIDVMPYETLTDYISRIRKAQMLEKLKD